MQVTVFYDISGVPEASAADAAANLGGAPSLTSFLQLLQQSGAVAITAAAMPLRRLYTIRLLRHINTQVIDCCCSMGLTLAMLLEGTDLNVDTIVLVERVNMLNAKPSFSFGKMFRDDSLLVQA